MSTAAAQKAFRTALQERKFAPVYYLYGDDAHLVDVAVRQLVSAAVDPATRDFNLDQRKGGDLSAESLGSLLGTPPMMADRRVMVIRDVGALKKDARAALDRYLKAPAPDTVLVLVAGADGKPDKQLLDRATSVEYPPLTGTQLPKWIAQRADALNATIDDDAAALLQDVVGSDLAMLSLEIEKAASYARDGRITTDVISAIVGVRREETLGHLLDAVARKDAREALAALPLVMQQPKASAVTTVMALTAQTLAIAWGQASGMAPARLAKEYFTLLKEAGSVFTGRAWGEAVSAWTKTVQGWAPRELDHALELLAQADLALKESRISSDEQVLASLVLGMCGGANRRSAA
jgi:DNA polymerase-3 subunit delta